MAIVLPKAARRIVATYAAMSDTRRRKLIRRGRIIAGEIQNPCVGQTTAAAHLYPVFKAAIEKLLPGAHPGDVNARMFLLTYRATTRDPKATLHQRVNARMTPIQQATDIEVQAAFVVAFIDAAGLEIAPDVRQWAMAPWLKATGGQ